MDTPYFLSIVYIYSYALYIYREYNSLAMVVQGLERDCRRRRRSLQRCSKHRRSRMRRDRAERPCPQAHLDRGRRRGKRIVLWVTLMRNMMQ